LLCRNIAFNLYDWDKVSSNDHVGDVTVPLEQLLGSTIQADERGLYPAANDGKLIGDDFHDHDLKIQVNSKELTEKDAGQSSATMHIRAKFTPYGE
jgi:phosphatidylserine decarboxylase